MKNKSAAYKAGYAAARANQSYQSHTALDGAWREARTWTEASSFHEGYSDGVKDRKAEANGEKIETEISEQRTCQEILKDAIMNTDSKELKKILSGLLKK